MAHKQMLVHEIQLTPAESPIGTTSRFLSPSDLIAHCLFILSAILCGALNSGYSREAHNVCQRLTGSLPIKPLIEGLLITVALIRSLFDISPWRSVLCSGWAIRSSRLETKKQVKIGFAERLTLLNGFVWLRTVSWWLRNFAEMPMRPAGNNI